MHCTFNSRVVGTWTTVILCETNVENSHNGLGIAYAESFGEAAELTLKRLTNIAL